MFVTCPLHLVKNYFQELGLAKKGLNKGGKGLLVK
jgi:hypothetical protein